MWTAEVPKKKKFQIVLEAEYSAEDAPTEALVAKITQATLDAYRPNPGRIGPVAVKVIQVEEEK